jgi:uncharacterized protein (TIGR02118 family)
MSEAKLVILYPEPKDRATFDKAYQAEHVPLMTEKSGGRAQRAVITKILGSAGDSSPYYLMAEVYFPSIEAINDFLPTPDFQAIAANAGSVSTGGPPTVLIAEDDVVEL